MALFRRRCRRPKLGTKLYLGRPDFAAQVELIPDFETALAGGLDRDFGWLPCDLPHGAKEAMYFRANAVSGIVEVPKINSPDVFA